MTTALDEVLRRRSVLVARSEALRLSLMLEAPVLVRPLAWADRARGAVRWCRQRPLLIAGVTAALGLLRPRRAVGWPMRAWAAWRLWRRVQPLLQSPWKPPAR